MFHLSLTWTNCEGTVELTMICHDDIIKWKYFPRYWLFTMWGETSGHRWIPLTKASEAELWCFLWSAPEQIVEQTIETPVIWDAILTSLYCHGVHVIPYHVFRYYTAELRCYNDSLSRRCPDNVEPVLDHFTKFFFYLSPQDLSCCPQFQAGRTRWMRLRNSSLVGG